MRALGLRLGRPDGPSGPNEFPMPAVQTSKFDNHTYLDASGTPWMQLDRWQMGRKPKADDAEHVGRSNGFSQTARLINVTFVDMHGNAHNVKVALHLVPYSYKCDC